MTTIPPPAEVVLSTQNAIVGGAVLFVLSQVGNVKTLVEWIQGKKPAQQVISPQPFVIELRKEFATVAALKEVEATSQAGLAKMEGNFRNELVELRKYTHDGLHDLTNAVNHNHVAAQNGREKIGADLMAINVVLGELKGVGKVNDAIAAEVRGQLASILARLPRTGGRAA